MADLPNATGLSKSSLYLTFGGTRELFLAAFDAYRAEREHDMHQILGRGPARQAIQMFFRMIITEAGTPGWPGRSPRGAMPSNGRDRSIL